MAVQQRITVDNEISGSPSVGRHPIVLLICVILCVPIAATSTTMATPSSTKHGIRESVVIPASDPEREAKELYDKALQQFEVATGKTLRAICAAWEARGCQCSGSAEEVVLVCKGLELVEVPVDLPIELIKLDLGTNNITNLPSRAFDMASSLEELILSDNTLARIAPDAFDGLGKLKRLVLHNCGLTHVPDEALKQLPSLTSLNLGNNHLVSIEEDDFPVMNNLIVLLLKRNQISEIKAGAFGNLSKLRVLELDDNLITSVSFGLENMTQLQEFSASNNRIRWLSKHDLPRSLTALDLRANPLSGIKPGAINNMPRLRKLVLSDARSLLELPSLDGCGALEILRVDRASLSKVPSNLCKTCPRLKSLELKSNKLRVVPELSGCRELRVLDLAGNHISSLHGAPFQGLGQLHDLLLSDNEIQEIPRTAFAGTAKLQVLDLEGNKIHTIDADAFAEFGQLEDLNLGNNVFPHLPATGLNRLLHLKTFNNPKLREFPPPETFPRIQTLVLSYAYHCCSFLPLQTLAHRNKVPPLQEAVLFPSDNEFDMSLWNNSLSDIWPQLHNLSKKFGPQINELWDSFGSDFTYPGNLPAYVEEYFEEDNVAPTRNFAPEIMTGAIQCLPLPGPFLPCADLFDWWTLRCGVWVVFLLAMLGNGTVVFVLIFSRSKMDVPRFLVCNLAAADFFMGVYLGILAVVDASTLGEFRMFAIPWQMSAGCQLAGFLAVLSSELSVYTLAVITLERNYAITHAMHLNKRLSLRHAGYIMTFGWAFALTMAVLPLFGVSDYRKFAVCLPFETTNSTASLAYVVFLMLINGIAFLILMGCYLKMYCAIRGSQAWNSNDSRIAKRMALLVFTDFLCWSPIAFFSLTAAFGLHLISLEQAKVFTVFVLPLNSCCNPFLYAILTKQFKKDCVLICKAIEESRVTRGIGRCRHSSNFSNRQTPANTNSLVERSSKELPPLLPGPQCGCAKLLEQQVARKRSNHHQESTFSKMWRQFLCNKRPPESRRSQSDQYAYQIAEIQQKQHHKRAGSMSSSENFSSSRSDSWRHGPPHHHCGIPLRILDTRRRHSSWLVTRKTSQDSNLSSSRNDSSTSATTASTSTFRMSRSSAGSSTPMPPLNTPRNSIPGAKPRLVRQSAVQEELSADLSASPPRLGVRFLPTIPSAADSSVQLDEESQQAICDSTGIAFYTILQSGSPLATLSSPKDKNRPP
ncbi:lutropin-choriogonadotropic hormone receptor isoform X2 [Phlebotomus argentipes]|uniref:lutropin-choriogonadotropic hormone receptor isoform X2 n=1 Tax=Phlebotomus argentipes TaxID=94469 RepID=UPI00289340A4|nr:lutropin-choriogonadotropic hormone receptor isoform X2 [Phlebotomus argentipes]